MVFLFLCRSHPISINYNIELILIDQCAWKRSGNNFFGIATIRSRHVPADSAHKSCYFGLNVPIGAVGF